MQLTKIDLSNIVAVGYTNNQLTLLVNRGKTVECLEISAPIETYQGLQLINSIASDNLIDITPEAHLIEGLEPEANIPMVPVRSAMASAIGYDESRQTLQVAFRNGSVYQYTDINLDTWEDFRKSESVGKVYNAKIKGTFPCRRVEN